MISVIVPLYNEQDYIENCLNSIITQTYKDIEIVVINDGSTDNSLQISEKIAFTDNRIKIISQQNSGLSAARNIGIENSSGELVMFVDADDELENYAIEKLYNALIEEGIDGVVGKISVIYDAHRELEEADNWYYNIRYNGAKIINDDIINDIHCSASAKLFKRSIIENYKIRFPKGLCYEDAYWHWTYFSVCKKIYFIKESVYKYFRRKTSIMSSTFENKEGLAIQHLYIVRKIFMFWEKNNILLCRELTAINLLEKYFWFAFRFSPNNEKINILYKCIKIVKKYNLNVEKNSTINKIYNGDLCFLFANKEDNIIYYTIFLQFLSVIDNILPKGSKRRKIVYIIARYCYKFLKSMKS